MILLFFYSIVCVLSVKDGLLFRVHGRGYTITDVCIPIDNELEMGPLYGIYKVKGDEVWFNYCYDFSCTKCDNPIKSENVVSKFLPLPVVTPSGSSDYSMRKLKDKTPPKFQNGEFGKLSFVDEEACKGMDLRNIRAISYNGDRKYMEGCHNTFIGSRECKCESNHFNCKSFLGKDCSGEGYDEEECSESAHSRFVCGDVDLSHVLPNGIYMDVSVDVFLEVDKIRSNDSCGIISKDHHTFKMEACDKNCKNCQLIGSQKYVMNFNEKVDDFFIYEMNQYGMEMYAYGYSPLALDRGKKNSDGYFDYTVSPPGFDFIEMYRFSSSRFEYCKDGVIWECNDDGSVNRREYFDHRQECSGTNNYTTEILTGYTCGRLPHNSADLGLTGWEIAIIVIASVLVCCALCCASCVYVVSCLALCSIFLLSGGIGVTFVGVRSVERKRRKQYTALLNDLDK